MSQPTLVNKNRESRVHFSEYIKTENTPAEETKPAKAPEPEQPKSE